MATPRATHLWVFVHGLHGTPQDFAYMTETLKSQHAKQEAEERTNDATRLRHVYLLSKCNAHLTGTMDGVDRAGERLEAEILAEMEACRRQSSTRHDDESSEAADPTCTSSSAASASPAARPCGGGERAPQQAPHRVLLSLVGHSLGGLIARFAAGQLAARGVFDGGRCVPCNFVTIGTPHLGSRDWRVVPFAPTIVSRVLGRTGRQLMLCDGQASATLEERNSTEGGACTQSNKGTPLLARLANGTYREAWASFPRRLVVACPHDLKVGFLSARLSSCNPYSSGDVPEAVSASKPHVVCHDPTASVVGPSNQGPPSDPSLHALELGILDSLHGLTFERFDVELPWWSAHEDLVVRRAWWSTRGADVVQAMLERLVVS
eukprot:m.201381 g.201381  ORF g.201381 m.201381 type:complete len:378 (+) comp18419_c1_seq1:764-1897(+)